MKQRIIDFAHEARKAGYRLQIMIRQNESALCFVGAIVLYEELQESLPSVLDDLKQSGVRVTFFFQNDDADEKCYAAHLGIAETYLSFQNADRQRSDMLENYEKYRVFAGFADADVAQLIRALRQEGRTVAVLGNRREHLPLMRLASLSVACDAFPYHQRSAQENLLDLFEEDGNENSERTSQAIRRHADLLIDRAHRCFGGLSAVRHTLFACRAYEFRYCLILRLLMVLQVPPFVFSLLAVILGRGLLSGAHLLYTTLWVSCVGIVYMLSIRIPQDRLREPIIIRQNTVERFLTDPLLLFPPLISAAVTALYALLLASLSVISASSCVSFLFVSLLCIQLLSIVLTPCSVRLSLSRRQLAIPIVILLLPVLILTVFSAVFSGFHQVFLLGEWNLITRLSLPVSVLLYLTVRQIILKRFVRTAK